MRTALAAVALAWRASRWGVTGLVVLNLLGAAGPVVATWLTKLVIDGLVGGAGPLGWYAVGLGAVGLVAAVTPHAVRYVRAELGRRVGVRSRDELMSAVGRFVGLGRFEEPAFVDRLRLAQRAGVSSPNGVLDGAVGVLGACLALVGFLGSLLVLSPLMAGIVVVAAAPAFAAQLVVARRRAAAMWDIGPVERREFFYLTLLSSVEAVKELRVFGTGSLLRQRMLADRRTADAALRRVDRHELRTQALLVLLSAGVAAGGLVWAVVAARAGQLRADPSGKVRRLG
ncbi:hypothetical protein GCM10009557_76440 [Virgisporangium ochraceum]